MTSPDSPSLSRGTPEKACDCEGLWNDPATSMGPVARESYNRTRHLPNCPSSKFNEWYARPALSEGEPTPGSAMPRGFVEAQELLSLIRLAAMDGYNKQPVSTVDDWVEECKKRVFLLSLAASPPVSPSLSTSSPELTAMTPVSTDSPVMVAWKAYSTGADYENTKRYAGLLQHVDGSLWAAFSAGFLAGADAAALAPDDARSLLEALRELGVTLPPSLSQTLRRIAE